MDFNIKTKNETVVSFARKIGYRPLAVDAEGEYSIVRQLTRESYPRFHIYLKTDKNSHFIISLHLDQKQASYKGSHSHSGEYEGDIVEKEARRIMALSIE